MGTGWGTGKAGACIYRFRALWFHEWRGRAVFGVWRFPVNGKRYVVYKGEDYTLEIYEMPSPEDAFGIYSLHIFKCERTDALGCIDCLSPYQLQAVVGNKYVSVVFSSGSSAAKDAVDELIRLYLPMDGKEAPQIPEILGIRSPYSGAVKYLRGPISVSALVRLWLNCWKIARSRESGSSEIGRPMIIKP